MTVTAIVHALSAGDKLSFSDWRADRDRREQAERKVELPSHNHD
jgi:hypothetical protein